MEVNDNVPSEGVEYSASIVKGRLCAQFSGQPPPTPTEPVCTEEAIGRYVYVHIPSDEQLTICEIEVYGKPMYESSHIFRIGISLQIFIWSICF